MFSSRTLLPVILLCLFLSTTGSTRAETFTGYLSSPTGVAPLVVDGRTVLISAQTRCSCSAALSVTTEHDIPIFPAGLEVSVQGSWDKKAQAWRAEQVCPAGLPTKTASGHGAIDAVLSTGTDLEIAADGRHLVLPAKAGAAALVFAPPLHAGDAPAVGEWIDYTADRLPNGSWALRSARIHEYLDTHAARRYRAWKPLAFAPPDSGRDGSLRVSHLLKTIKLPGDADAQSRVARVGATVVPAWEKNFAVLYPDERHFRFYVAGKLPTAECTALPDATVLVPQANLKKLPEDAQLAAVLAGCVAEIEEEQGPAYANQEGFVAGMELGGFVPVAGLGGTLGAAAYQHHLDEVLEQQRSRVALFYLKAAGYPSSAGAQAWERLASKHGEPDLSKPPGVRAAMMYQALAEEQRAAPDTRRESASVVK